MSLVDDCSLYHQKNTMISDSGYMRVAPAVFYRDLFPVGSFERQNHFEDERPNGIFILLDSAGVHRYTLTDELDELSMALGDHFSILSPVSYFGRQRSGRNARELYAFAIDLDGVGLPELKNLLYQFSTKYTLMPTYLVNSGTGLHLYYVLDEPLPLYPQMQRKLKAVKYALIRYCWTGYTSTLKEPQMQGILQGFRMVGSRSKLGVQYPVVAYRLGKKLSLEEILQVLPDEVFISSKEYQSELPLQLAKELYPEWYQRRVIEQQPKGRWHIKRDLYEWWKRTMLRDARYGHRYFCMMCLAIYAMKCDVPEDELWRDAIALRPMLDSDASHPFTVDDVGKALEVYNENYCTFPRRDVSVISGIAIPPNKRNGRSQALHLKVARATRDVIYDDWRAGNGRPKGSGSALEQVQQWRAAHPTGRKIDCERETGLSRHTVLKWWDPDSPAVHEARAVAARKTPKMQPTAEDLISWCHKTAEEQGISVQDAYQLYIARSNRSFLVRKTMAQPVDDANNG